MPFVFWNVQIIGTLVFAYQLFRLVHPLDCLFAKIGYAHPLLPPNELKKEKFFVICSIKTKIEVVLRMFIHILDATFYSLRNLRIYCGIVVGFCKMFKIDFDCTRLIFTRQTHTKPFLHQTNSSHTHLNLFSFFPHSNFLLTGQISFISSFLLFLRILIYLFLTVRFFFRNLAYLRIILRVNDFGGYFLRLNHLHLLYFLNKRGKLALKRNWRLKARLFL